MIIRSQKIKHGIDWVGKYVSSPEQRLLLGATALATQPFIDYNNKNVDENTRMISVARTLAKIIAGTAVGVGVRYGCIKLAEKYGKTVLEELGKNRIKVSPQTKNDIFAPDFKNLYMSKEKFEKRLAAHRATMGTILATVVMVGTNFLIDAPLTRFLTGQFSKFITKNKQPQAQEVKK